MTQFFIKYKNIVFSEKMIVNDLSIATLLINISITFTYFEFQIISINIVNDLYVSQYIKGFRKIHVFILNSQ